MVSSTDSLKLESARERAPLRYMPQLDGLRAVAIVAVFVAHWGLPTSRASAFLSHVQWGPMGVWLFFVLSGFLITGILLRGRAEIEEHSATTGHVARIFYSRRFLRILPVYYLTLLLITVLLPASRRLFWWDFTYNTNFWSAAHPGQYLPGTHFWSLAVEEQFYLIWPWIILLIPSRYLFRVIVLAVFSSLAFRFACSFLPLGHRGAPAYVLLPGCADKLALGAMLAWFWDEQHAGRFADWKDAFCRAALWIGLPGLVACEVLRAYRPDSRLAMVFLSFFAALFFTWIVNGAAHGFTGIGRYVLEWKPIRYLGKISYGLYLFHYFVPLVLDDAHVPRPSSWAGQFVLYSAVSIAVASLSWYAFEKPINGLKRFFAYGESQISPVSAPMANRLEPVGIRP